jgi:hypothetical protein
VKFTERIYEVRYHDTTHGGGAQRPPQPGASANPPAGNRPWRKEGGDHGFTTVPWHGGSRSGDPGADFGVPAPEGGVASDHPGEHRGRVAVDMGGAVRAGSAATAANAGARRLRSRLASAELGFPEVTADP